MGFKNGKYEMGYKDTFYYYERFISDKYGSEDKKDKRWSIIRAIVISLVILVIWLVYYSKNGESPTLVLAFYNTIEWWGFTKRSAHRYIKRCKEINNEKEQSYIYRFEIPQIIPVKYYQYFTVAQEMKLVLLPINIGSELLEEFAQQPYTSIRSMVVCRRNKEIFDVIEEYTSEPRLFIRDSEEDYRAFCSSTFQEANNIVSKYLAEYNYYVSFIDVDFDNKLINYMTNNIKPDASNIGGMKTIEN
ncbi:MAG: hypothetical protein KZQ96_13445 [Candidatus Thiodiazotropha sp. (ex Lucinoma borealis)]|nr:hypothetical protein [Candidatus Thiodiazotropha sp. (ex Lucinoma borealis)]